MSIRTSILSAACGLLGLACPVSAFADAVPDSSASENIGEYGYSLQHQFDPNAAIAGPDALPDPVHIPALPDPTLPQLAPLNLGPLQAGIDPSRMGAFAGTQSHGLSLEATMDAPNLITSPSTTTGRLSLGIAPSVLPQGLGLSLEAASPVDLTARPGDPTAFTGTGTMSLRGDLPVGNGSDLSVEARRDALGGNDSNREVYLRYKLGW